MSAIIPPDSLWVQALARTLVHFLWQGAAVGLAAFLLLRIVRLTAASRYGVGIAALAMMLAAPVGTFVVLVRGPAPAVQVAGESQISGPMEARTAGNAGMAAISGRNAGPATGSFAPPALRTFAPSLIIVAWLAGVAALSVRLLGGWLVAQRFIRRAVRPAAPEIRALLSGVAGRLPFDRMVRLLESSAVAVPVTIGWLKPVVLLPAAAMTGLSPAQIEALLAHELAHIWRHDYLLNLLQSAVETLLFYHPAVWWASRLVRTEREHCCDDAAVRVCDRLAYVTALSDLAAIGRPRVVMAASGGPLLRRVARILGKTSGRNQAGAGWLPVFVLVLLTGGLGPAALTPSSAAVQETRPAIVQAGVPGGVAGGVKGGIPAGTAGGVPGGISGGIAGRIDGGVAGGVAGGVSGGVAGGIDRGVAGGVAGGVGSAKGSVSQSSGSTSPGGQHQRDELWRALEAIAEGARQEDEIAKLEAALKLARERYERAKKMVEVGLLRPQALTEIDIDLGVIERKITAVRQGGLFRELQEKIVDLEGQLERARLSVERTNRLFTAGLVSAQALKEAEAEVAAIADKLVAAGKQLQETEADLQRRQAERQAEIALIEKVMRDIGTRGGEEQRRFEEQLAKRDAGSLDAILAEVEAQRGAASAHERDRRLLSLSAPVADQNEIIRAGDLLVIDIAREPQLWRVYGVADTGTIRLPLIGNIPVLGLTASRVREAIVGELTQRRLADGSSVTVSLRRLR